MQISSGSDEIIHLFVEGLFLQNKHATYIVYDTNNRIYDFILLLQAAEHDLVCT